MRKVGKTTIVIDRPIYGEWVTIVDSGTGERSQDRPFKGWQPTDVEVDVWYSEVAGYVWRRPMENLFHAKQVTGSMLEIEDAYRRCDYPKYDALLR